MGPGSGRARTGNCASPTGTAVGLKIKTRERRAGSDSVEAVSAGGTRQCGLGRLLRLRSLKGLGATAAPPDDASVLRRLEYDDSVIDDGAENLK
jgi:hypothetical protein